jgi:predicted TIM-barrel fold metal-dependent hydrolase
MVIDSHCHAWATWPYQPAVPDPESRGRVEQLLYEMDACGVDQAVIVCAQIDRNPENNAYVAGQVQRYPARLHQVADLDSEWSPTYHQPGSAARLRAMAKKWPLAGFTHYLKREEDGAWLYSEQGQALFRTAAELNLFASLSCYPHQQAAVRRAAERFPEVPILCHHLGHSGIGPGSPAERLAEVLASACLPNIYIKISGFAYAAQVQWEYPYPDVLPIVRAIYEHFGAQRLCWGSDYPVVRFSMTYRQALEAFRTHCDFIHEADRGAILGETLSRLLMRTGAGG